MGSFDDISFDENEAVEEVSYFDSFAESNQLDKQKFEIKDWMLKHTSQLSEKKVPVDIVINDDLRIDTISDCIITSAITELPDNIKFKVALHNFGCVKKSLTSLKNFPDIVEGSFHCNNTSIKDLQGGPMSVKGNYFISNIKTLVSLKGAPKIVGMRFVCVNCPNLKEDLNELPQALEYICPEVKKMIADADSKNIIDNNA